MKKIMITSAIFALLLGFASCGGNDSDVSYAPQQSVTLSQTSFNVDTAAQVLNVTVKTDHEFAAYSTESWLKVTPSNSNKLDTALTISVAANRDTIQRVGTVTVWAGGTRSNITVTQAKAVKPNIKGPDGYSLVWNDEFDGKSLSSDWTFEVQPAGWVNNEKQAYVNDGKVTEVSNGTLKINLIKDGSNINSARIYAKKSTGWKYGYVEARIKLPKGKGTWPAFWMMPVNFKQWPADGEIDIMEAVGYNPNVVYSTIHCTKYNNGGTAIESANKAVDTGQSDFHLYGLKWTKDYMTFYVDNQAILTYNNDGTGVNAWPFDNPFYIILNLAWGGSWGGSQGVDESALPASMEVDYVRVFQAANAK
jgi:beta-glucanase (GH16 family)